MSEHIEKLAAIFKEMVDNYRGKIWKNIPLGKQAFEIMRSLPDTLPGEYNSPIEKAALLSQMLCQMEETSTPRFSCKVREYIQTLNPNDKDNSQALTQLYDFIDPTVSMEDFCKRYDRSLKFDPIERSEQWENVIYDVERECDARLDGIHRTMGFCFRYWHEKRTVLQSYNIDWKSPSIMNPRVIFD